MLPRVRVLMRWVPSLVMMAAMALAPVAQAQTEADIATAREIARDAFTAYDGGDFAQAEELFDRASELYPAPTLLLGLAQARVKLAKYVAARETYLRIVHSKLPADASDAFREAQATARRELQEVEPKIGWVTLSLEGATAAEVVITIDEEEVPVQAIGARRPVDPGRHVVRVMGEGIEPFEAAFEIGEGGRESVAVRVERKTPNPDLPPPGDEPEPEARDQSSVLPIVGFALLGVGGAGIVVGAITGGVASSQHGELSDQCVGGRCEPAQYDTLDGFETMSTVSTIGIVAGAVIAGVGLTLVLVAPSEGEASTSLQLGPGSLSLSTTF